MCLKVILNYHKMTTHTKIVFNKMSNKTIVFYCNASNCSKDGYVLDYVSDAYYRTYKNGV